MLEMSNAEVQIFVRQQSKDAAGGMVTKWVCSAHKVPVYIQTNTAAENVRGGAERTDFRGMAMVPGYITVNAGDRIKWGGRTLQVDAAHEVYAVADVVDRYQVEWSEVTGAGL